MRTPDAIRAEMDAAEVAHNTLMDALHDELYAAEEAADPGCHERAANARIESMAVSIAHFERVRRALTADVDQQDTE